MKKLMSVLLGLSLMIGAATITLAEEKKEGDKKTDKKKGGKKKAAEKKTEAK